MTFAVWQQKLRPGRFCPSPPDVETHASRRLRDRSYEKTQLRSDQTQPFNAKKEIQRRSNYFQMKSNKL